ncbi:conserved hypothetical protein [Gluconacetobacter diazotrophicus PA1 5]|nr:conserved hypothetical protein [Gluconacetobacter diazotrophicus PA1 5]
MVVFLEVSIHAPAQGATIGERQRQSDTAFQSTLPHRERRFHRFGVVVFLEVSIHAPAQGATHVVVLTIVFVQVSIHAPAQGATIRSLRCNRVYVSFNPRSRTGSDNRRAPICGANLCFNPRSRTGSDLLFGIAGASGSGFNPRSRTGSDKIHVLPSAFPKCFNPRSRTGSDGKRTVMSWRKERFQSTLPHRERRRAYYHLVKKRENGSVPRTIARLVQ